MNTEKARELLRIAAYPRRGTNEEGLDLFSFAEMVQKDFSSDDLETPSKPQVETVFADWRDTEGLIEGFRKALLSFGITMIDHPDCEGSDQNGFILSSRPLTAEELKDECIQREDEDGDSN